MTMEQRPEDLDRPRPTSTPEPQPGGNAHGRVRSWLLVAVVLVAFVTGGAALIVQMWWLFWVCVGVVVLSAPVGRLVGIMNDTVQWAVPLERPYQPQGHIMLTRKDADD